MRIYLKISGSNEVVSFDHQPWLVGTIHKWLGQNKEHGNISLYCFSRLEGGVKVNGGLKFDKGCSFFFSAYDVDLIKRLINGIQSDPSMFSGLRVEEVIMQEDPDLSDRELFYNASPVFIKRKVGDQYDHILYDDLRASECLKETLQKKMSIAGISDDSLDISFDTSYLHAGTKKINYKGVENRTSWCPIIIKGKAETKLFAWTVGVGNSTGIGFGSIK